MRMWRMGLISIFKVLEHCLNYEEREKELNTNSYTRL